MPLNMHPCLEPCHCGSHSHFVHTVYLQIITSRVYEKREKRKILGALLHLKPPVVLTATVVIDIVLVGSYRSCGGGYSVSKSG